MSKPRLSEAERQVMEQLWLREPQTSAEVVEALTSRAWSETTVKTLLSRLVKKGFATFQVDGRKYLYRPLLVREADLAEDQDRFLGRWSGIEGFALLARFVEKTPLTAVQVASLKKLLEEKSHES